jgi:hypothetical protein
MTVDDDNRQHDRSSSAPAPTTVNVNPIRQPTAFALAAPNPTTGPPGGGSEFESSSSSSGGGGPKFYYFYKEDKTKATPIHAAMSADGTSVFCVEGYVNTPELSAGRGGGLSQGLPANGPYKSLFRAGSRSESRASNHHKANVATTAAAAAAAAAAPALHVLC